ncbi:MAG: signal peptidase I [Parcubacteria group bacterium]
MDTPVEKKFESFWKELFKLLLLAAVIVIPFRLYIAQPFIIDGASMDPTFKNGQYLIVDELTYHFKEPLRGSVVIFKHPLSPKEYLIKRVIGLPGETVDIKDGVVTISNSANPSGFTLNEPYVKYSKPDTTTLTLGAGEYFVMGDNRYASADSRIWGAVPEDHIVGRPIIRVSPPAIWPGDETDNSNNNNE